MKKIVGILGLTCVLVACSVTRKYDTTGFTIDKNYVYYKDEPMCELVGIEFALDDHKLVKELTFKVVDNSNNSKITELIAFLHEKQFVSSEFKHKLFIHFMWFEFGVKFLQ